MNNLLDLLKSDKRDEIMFFNFSWKNNAWAVASVRYSHIDEKNTVAYIWLLQLPPRHPGATYNPTFLPMEELIVPLPEVPENIAEQLSQIKVVKINSASPAI